MDGPHVQGMSEDKWDVLVCTEISQPVPGKHAFGTHDNVFSKRFDCSQKGFRIGFYVAMQDGVTLLIEDAQIHFVGVKVDSAVKFVLFGVKSHEKASFVKFLVPCSIIAAMGRRERGGLLYYQVTKPVRPT
jgi:hypothetical protein